MSILKQNCDQNVEKRRIYMAAIPKEEKRKTQSSSFRDVPWRLMLVIRSAIWVAISYFLIFRVSDIVLRKNDDDLGAAQNSPTGIILLASFFLRCSNEIFKLNPSTYRIGDR
ncbi:hypothetical protein TNIN_438111 [Trichonephila inaurata madagascariensis]|uniref:Uncharacterized protein n=1 Tax=Trichonephila inaurata madagascariensis TaxID=2747483 RepID=A0A8X6XX05_9ARAC|nr:hypothetical protein TNIN_438111 [Trichonephila inaurata madagascariensis]